MNPDTTKPRQPVSMRCKNLIKSQLHFVFEIGQRFGFDILPRHFYSEIPDLRTLKNTTSWRSPFTMSGVLGASVDEQSAWAEEVVVPELRPRLAQGNILHQACLDNGEPGYGQIEAEFLHCFVKRYKPGKILQIGCGVSTAVCLRAALEISYQPRIICVEPHPTAFLRRSSKDGVIKLMEMKAQDIDLGILSQLGDGDLFFVDSSHTLGPAGEVTRIILEMLPRLGAGVFAHFHDVGFPYDYQAAVLEEDLFFPHETALLLAFLTLNPHFRIMASFSMLHHDKQESLRKLFPHYIPATFVDGIRTTEGHCPSSIFIRRIAETEIGKAENRQGDSRKDHSTASRNQRT
jgi:hypothetical protein